jgi:hypothetical protein
LAVISKVKLRVQDAVRDDDYKDIARVHWHHRGQPSTKVGTLVKVSYFRGDERITRIFSIRGLGDKDEANIRIDHVNRNEMRLKLDETHEFTIETTHWWEKLRWACTATDPGARIAAWIAVWSGILGIIGVILGAVGIVPIVKEQLDHKPPARVPASPSTPNPPLQK